MTSVAVGVITFGRPKGLAALLAGIAAIERPRDTEVRLVIVDNDADGSAATVVDGARATMPWPIEYAVESRRGIPHARNRAVELAAGCDVIAFVDDDEVPDSAWLVELLRVRAATGADVVTGPVLPQFEVEPAAWLAPFFARPRFADGESIGYARTSNVLIDIACLPTDGPTFAPKLAMTGGSDTHLFMRMIDGGAKIAWADRALVHETMPATRVNVAWLVRREYRRGNTLSLCLRDLHDSNRARVKRVGRAGVEVLRGLGRIVAAPAVGKASAVRGAQRIALAAGMMTGLLNVRYEEYAVIHGD